MGDRITVGLVAVGPKSKILALEVLERADRKRGGRTGGVLLGQGVQGTAVLMAAVTDGPGKWRGLERGVPQRPFAAAANEPNS